VTFVHFHSYPHVGRESIEKVKRLTAIIDRYQLNSRLYLVPFADIQREMTVKTNGAMRVILYRRAMMRIAAKIVEHEDMLGLVTGDSISQVASQTLENLLTVSAAVRLPIYRPLIGEDKKEIVATATAIGTYQTSIEPHDDCCTLFVPEHPELHSTPRQAEAEEVKLDLEKLIAAALTQAEVINF
jgi:thiamine biosynthesis protein ThiI